jgi:hypothetical protein
MNINEDKIEEFMDKHGVRGFLKLYFAEFFFRTLMESVKAGKEQSSVEEGSNIEFDTGIQHHIANELSGSQLQERKKEIKKECGKKAEKLINLLEDDEEFKELFEGNFDLLENEETQERINEHIIEIAEEIGEDNEP